MRFSINGLIQFEVQLAVEQLKQEGETNDF